MSTCNKQLCKYETVKSCTYVFTQHIFVGCFKAFELNTGFQCELLKNANYYV